MYRHTRIRTGTITPVNYSALARGVDVNEAHPAIAKSHTFISSAEKETFAYTAGTLEEMTKRIEEQAQVQREQFGIIQAQKRHL